MLLPWMAILTILLVDGSVFINCTPVHQEDSSLETAESKEVVSEMQSPTENVVIGKIVNDSNNKIENTEKSEQETRKGKDIQNKIRDLLLDNTFETVDFSNAILSTDGTKECVNKTHFVETVVSDRYVQHKIKS